MSHDKSPFVATVSKEFLDYWDKLANGDLIPHTRAFLTTPPFHLIASVCIAELTAQGMLLRFLGRDISEDWKEDFTETYWETRVEPGDRQRFADDMKSVCTHPVGIHQMSIIRTSQHRNVSCEYLVLPLAVDDQKPPRCVRVGHVSEKLKHNEQKLAFAWPAGSTWIDIGAGVPKKDRPVWEL